MTSKYRVALLVAMALVSIALLAEAGQGGLQPETMASAKSAKADAYETLRKSGGDAMKAIGKDKMQVLGLTKTAQGGWETEFRPTASPEVIRRVEGAFAIMRKQADGGTSHDYNMQRQVVDKSMLGQVIPEVEAALRAKKAENALAWFQVYVVKFEFDKKPAEVVAAVKAAAAAPDAAKIRIAGLALRRHLAGEAIDEVSEAPENIEKKDLGRAGVVTTEGRTYFLGIQADLNRRMGKAEGDNILKAYDKVLAAAGAGDVERAKQEFEKIRTALTRYQALLTKAMG